MEVIRYLICKFKLLSPNNYITLVPLLSEILVLLLRLPIIKEQTKETCEGKVSFTTLSLLGF